MTRELSVDRSRCSGHGRCYTLAPDYFDCDEEGFPIVLRAHLTEDDVAGVTDAVDNCPERAIRLTIGDAG